MCSVRFFLLSMLALLGWIAEPSRSLANDSQVMFGAGGLQFQQTDEVRMEREELYLSPREVRVSYVFRNLTDHGVHMTVAFPMPDVDVGEMVEAPHEFHPSSRDGDIFDFHVEVNGLEIVSDLDARAYRADQPDKEVTAILKESRMPLLSEPGVSGQYKADTKALVAAGLMSEDQSGNLRLNWIVKANFHWRQIFPAGQTTRITHRYKPVIGFYWSGNEISVDDRNLSDVCPDKAFVDALKALPVTPPDHLAAYETVQYILKTGANWAGPIGRFRLEINKARADLVSLCPIRGLKLERRGQSFVAEAAQYVPTTDIRLLFVYRGCDKAPCKVGDLPPGLLLR
jgi:hypothetical protein